MAKSNTHGREPSHGAHARIERACAQAVAGKHAVRQLASWVAGSGVCEVEFRVLWHLRTAAGDSSASTQVAMLDQAELAERLAASPAQISAVVERLRRRELATRQPHVADRRRQMWQITAKGAALVLQIVAAAEAPSVASATGEAA